jgi:hypothetical protein
MNRASFRDTINAYGSIITLIGQPTTLSIGTHRVVTLTEDGVRDLIDSLEKYLACRVA